MSIRHWRVRQAIALARLESKLKRRGFHDYLTDAEKRRFLRAYGAIDRLQIRALLLWCGTYRLGIVDGKLNEVQVAA